MTRGLPPWRRTHPWRSDERAATLLLDLSAGRQVPWAVPDVLTLLAAGAWRFGGWGRPFVAGARGQP